MTPLDIISPQLDDVGSQTLPGDNTADGSDYTADSSDYTSDYSKDGTIVESMLSIHYMHIYYEWIASEKQWVKLNPMDPDPIGLSPGKYDGQILSIKRT